MDRLSLLSGIKRHLEQAYDLLERQRAGDSEAIRFFHRHHPPLLDAEVAWRPADIPESVIADATPEPPEPADAALATLTWGIRCRSWEGDRVRELLRERQP